MNVTLPNGTLITDVPDDITQKELARIAIDNDLAVASDFGDLFDETTTLGALGEAGKRLVGGIATGTARVGTGLAELIPGVDDKAAREVQRDVDEFVADKLAYDPAYDESYVAQLGEVVGEMAPMVGSLFLPGGAAASATRLATMIGPAVSEGGMDRAEYEERTGEALSTAERLTAKGADVGLGMLERLGIPTRILKGLPRGFFDRPDANPIARRIESMIASGLQEGIQEVGQGIARDITTLAIYDPDRKIADSVIEDFTLGGGAGAVLDLAIGLAQTPLKGRKGRAPKPIEEMTEEEVAREEELRQTKELGEQARRAKMDATIGAADIGPQLPPEVREDPIDPTAVDASLPVEEMAGQVVTRLGSRLPVAKTFSVGSMDNKFYAEIDGEQFGPALEDPTVAQELSNRLTEASRQLGKRAEVEYIVENSGIEYTGQQAAEVRRLGRAIPSPQERIIRAEDANAAVGRDIASVINRQKADRGEAETEVFTLEEVRSANKGDVGNLGDVLAVKDADFLAFGEPQPATPSAVLDPSRPRQPALGRRQALRAFSSSFDNLISSERAFTNLFASKRMDLTVNSEPFRGLVKRIIGKTPSKQNPLDNLSANERRYLYHRIRKLPSFQEQATQIPDFSTKTPDGELVRIARRQVEMDRPMQVDPIRVLDDLVVRGVIPQDVADSLNASAPSRADAPAGFNPSAILDVLVRRGLITPEVARSLNQGAPRRIPQAELGRIEAEARRTARPVERAEEGVPAGQELVPYDLDQSALGQQLRDAIKRFGIDDQYATRMVEQVGKARRDSDGNIYIMPIKKRDDGTIVAGSAQSGAKVIQVGLDAVMQDVNKGASYEEAVAKIMNHEILHALRAMDLFTAEEYSLLERLSRKYQKPGEGKTYGQWAVDTYGDVSAVTLQEEAIAEMISDALTTGVVMDGTVKKPTGKPRTIFNKIIDFFKRLVGVAKDNDIDSFKTLVDSIQSGAVGRRERGQIRTPLLTERVAKEIPERGITVEDIGLETGKRGRPLTARQVISKVRQDLGDAPETVDEAMLSLRLNRAEDQGYDTSKVFYHGTASPNIKRFRSDIPYARGVIAGHFTTDPEFANRFVPIVAYEDRGEAQTVYPVFLRVKNTFDPRNREMINLVEGEVRKGRASEGYRLIADRSLRTSKLDISEADALLFADSAVEEAIGALSPSKSMTASKYNAHNLTFEELEILSPFIKAAGFDSYLDFEGGADASKGVTGIAVFNPADIKGVFADFDPSGVPEGMRYEDDIMFSRRRVGTTGQYVGAPKGIDTPPKLRTLIKTVRGLAEEGEYGRFWYERSGRQILDLVGGDKSEAEKIVQAIAITSAQTPVAGNFQYALQAYYQHKNGEPIRTGMFTTDMSTKLENMFNGVPWEGRKTNNFYINLMREIDPTLVQGVTNDLWMMRAFQFFGDAPTDAQYNFVEAETKKLANQLGWEPQQVQAAIWVALKSRMESKEVRKKTEATSEKAGYIRFDKDKSGKKVRVILDPEQHRKNWFRTAMRHSPTLEEQEAAKFDYMDAAQASLAQSSWESIPSISSGHMSGILEAPMSQKLDYHKQISSAMLDNNGNDIIAMELGLASPGAFEAPGFFEGVTSPGSQTQVVLPKKFKATELNEAEASAVDLLEAYSATVGILLKQDGVGYHRPFYQKNLTETKANGLDVDFGRPLTTEEMVELGDLYIKETGDPYASPISTPQGVRFINFNVGDAEADLRRFRERVRSIRNPAEKRAMQEELRKRSAALGKTNKKFQQDIRRVLEQADLPDGVATLFASYNGYLGNNWTEKKNGENYLQESRLAQRPDLQQRVRDLVSRLDPRIKAVESEFADKYGWSPREDLNTAYRARPASPEIKDIDTEVIEPRRTIDPEQADQAIDKNIAAIAENPTGVPRFSVKASPEAQYIAQNPNSALDADEPMFAVRGEIPAVDRLTRGPDREAPNGKVFMDATNTGPFMTFMTKLKQGALDRYAPLAKYYQKIPGLRELEADSSAIAAAYFADHSKAILAAAVKYGVPVYRDGLTKVEDFTHNGDTYRGLIGVMSLIYNKDVGDLRKLAQAYAMVQRGDYLKGKNKLTPVDPESKREVLEAVEALTDADGYNPVKKWHEVWSAYNDRTIDFLKATGILNDKTADIWKGSSYIPFYRTGASEDALPNAAKGVFGDLTRMSEFRAYQGSDKAVDVGLIESVVLNLSAAIDMGMKNVTQQRITRDMQKMGLARQISAKSAIPKGVNAIDFKVNGNKVRFEIDDNLIYDSMTIMPSGTVEQLATKYLGMPSNLLREFVTRDPGFMMANMLRDTLSTWTTSGASFVPIIDTVKGLGDGVEKLEKLGVVGGYDFSIDKQDIVKFYEAENKRRTEQMNPINMFGRIWDWAGKATTASDAATRNAVYNDVLARTGNEAEAAFQAMEIINYARRGSHPLARVLTAAIPFLNARFQGLDVFVRAAAGNYSTRRDQPAGMGQLKLAYRGGIIVGLTALYYLMVGEEDWYNEQEDHIRELNWLAPTDSGVPIKFPIPFEVGLIFKTLPEAILANTIGNQSDRELRQTLQRGIVSTLEVNPFAIQAIAPLFEAAFNYDAFTGRPIVPYYVDKMTPGLTGNANTSQIATDIGKVLPISPLKIDHVMFGYTGTLGSYLILAADSAYRTVTGAEDKRPAKNIYEFPLWRRFFGSKEGSGLRSDAYDLYNDVNEVVTTMNTLSKDGRVEELEAYIASRRHLINIKEPVYTLKKQLDNARQQKRRIIASDMDDEVKRRMIDDLDASLNEYLKVVPRLKELADAPFIQTTF